MPPQIALLSCTVFVLYLLWLESQGSRTVSKALWIPTIWMLMIASRSLGAWFGTTDGNESGSSLDRIVLSGLSVVGVLVLVRRRFKWSSVLRRHKWLLLLLAYMLISTLWSEITFIALKRWYREAIVIIMALVTISECDPRLAFEVLLRRSAYVLIPFSLVLIKYYPALGRQYGRWSGVEMWTGVTSQKNSLGRLCMITIFFMLWTCYRRFKEHVPVRGTQLRADMWVLLIAVYLFNGANSSTSVTTFAVGVLLFATLQVCRNLRVTAPRAALAGILILLIGFGVSAPFLGGSNIAMFSASLSRDETLTGRTEVWAAVLPAMEHQPLLGYGFGSFWTDTRRELYEIPTAHNGYLDILLEQGALGLGLYVMWLLSCLRQFQRGLEQDYTWASFGLCLLLMGLAYNGTESALNTFTEQMTAVVVLTSFVMKAEFVTDHRGEHLRQRGRLRPTEASWYDPKPAHGTRVGRLSPAWARALTSPPRQKHQDNCE